MLLIDMDNRNQVIGIILFAMVLGAVLLAGSFVMPWQNIKWGRIDFGQSPSVTVTGEAESKQKTQVATFNAGISSINDNKDTAISEVNQKVSAIINAVKGFGIPAEDVQTQNLSVYQNEEQYYEEGRQKMRPGQWRVNNTVEIKLRQVERASDLTSILTQSGATNVYGPNFTLDDTKSAQTELLSAAITNAREKAEKIAASSSRKLGKTISVVEGSAVSPVSFFGDRGGAGGGGPIEPGTGTISKTVTMTFELK